MAWQPLSVRDGKRPADEPYEGVPPHLEEPLKHWLEGVLGVRGGPLLLDLAVRLAAAARVRFVRDPSWQKLISNVVQALGENGDTLLDAVDVCIYEVNVGLDALSDLNQLLRRAGSVWRVGDKGRALTRRVNAAARTSFKQAVSPGDDASTELEQAWSKVYGRDPDASDAWDHAIKAVEAVLIPIVVPNQDKAQFGHVLGQLDSQGEQWQLLLKSKQSSTPIKILVGVLGLMWPNPDRHSGPDHRVPTLAEAQAVVHLAVTIVQWARDGVLSKR